MVRPPYFDSNGMKKGAWSKEEDDKLRDFIQTHGHSNWRLLPVFAGLARCGKSCRLRWMNYLKPGLKRGNFTKHESDLIIALHKQLGNKWSTIAANLPGRTDNEVNYYWHAHVHKRSERNRVAGEVIRGTQMPEEQQTQMPKEQQSSEINVCNIATYQNESTPSNDQNLENINVVDSTAQSDQGNNIMTHEEYYQTCYDLPPLSEDAELDRILLCQEMHNVCMFSESDGGYSTAESQLGDFWADEPLGEEATLWYFDDIKDML